MKYAYYPGCSLHGTSIEFDMSTRAVASALDIELQEIPGWTCCGASSAHETSELLALALPARNLLLAQDMNLDVMVCCAACYSRLREANEGVKSEDNHDKVAQIVGRPYDGKVQTKHFLDIIVNEYGLDALSAKVQRTLADLKVASYYGCLLVRKPEIVAFDDPENPTFMDEFATALGAKAVNWPYKTECCGGSLSLTRTDVVLRLVKDILEMAIESGADCIMVACPLCQANLDLRQTQINRRFKTDLNIPILYFTQLLGLALDLPVKGLGLSKLMVNPDELLKARALV